MIPQNTLAFLSNLNENNNRSWFEEHKPEYSAAKKQFEDFIGSFIEQLTQFEPDFGLLQAKDCVFRIYRDVRFSKNKAPYKSHLAAGINKGGKRVHFPGYYLHIEPNGNSIFGGGIWHPEKEMMAKIRQEIDYCFEEFSSILNQIKTSGLFSEMMKEEMLSRPPKGYEADNPAIEYLKRKNFIFSCTLSDKQITQKDFLNYLMKAYQTLYPFVAFIERALD